MKSARPFVLLVAPRDFRLEDTLNNRAFRSRCPVALLYSKVNFIFFFPLY